jgi:hypothetical protein
MSQAQMSNVVMGTLSTWEDSLTAAEKSFWDKTLSPTALPLDSESGRWKVNSPL